MTIEPKTHAYLYNYGEVKIDVEYRRSNTKFADDVRTKESVRDLHFTLSKYPTDFHDTANPRNSVTLGDQSANPSFVADYISNSTETVYEKDCDEAGPETSTSVCKIKDSNVNCFKLDLSMSSVM